MSIDEQHIALPKLYGAPAYARPPMTAQPTERPFDPDELPLEVEQTEEERAVAAMLPARAYATGGVDLGQQVESANGGHDSLRPQSLRLRSIAGRLLGGGKGD